MSDINVWRMNLKSSGIHQFVFCHEHKDSVGNPDPIVGFGWAMIEEAPTTWDEYKLLSWPTFSKKFGYPYRRAMASLDKLKSGDLVWVRDPQNGVYYLCKIKGEADFCYDESHKQADMCNFWHCEYRRVGNCRELPDGITFNQVFSRSTILPVRQEPLLSISKSLFDTLASER